MAKKPKPPAGRIPLATRPRRRPPANAFEKGNEIGKDHRWPKGVSGNPAGFPKDKRAAMDMLKDATLARFSEYIESLVVEAIGYKPGAKQEDIDLVHRLRGTGTKKSNDGIHQLIFDRVFGRIPLEAKFTGAPFGAAPAGPELNLKHLPPAEQEAVAAALEKADRLAAKARAEAEAAEAVAAEAGPVVGKDPSKPR